MAGSVQAIPGINLVPAPTKVALSTNYIQDFDWLDRNVPGTIEQEVERYGNRTVSSFLKLVGAEEAMQGDLIRWSEQGRLHVKYTDITTATADGQDTSVLTVGGGSCVFRVNQLVFLADPISGAKAIAVISAVSGANFTVEWYKSAGQPVGFNASSAIVGYVFGSEFKKGTSGMQGSLEAESDVYSNKPVIIKDKYAVNGSDMTNITWVKTSTESGETGYYWYFKSQDENRLRYEDYLEMMMIEAQEAENGSGAEAFLSTGTTGVNAGTEGLFEAIDNRGNVWGGGNPETLDDFDSVIERLDGQGAISDNVLFNNRQFSFDFSDMVSAQGNTLTGTPSWGLFDNDEDMALNLGFAGFKRGGYEFYQTDWKYLNDVTTRGGITAGKVNGIMVPAGTKSVYDQIMGQHIKRPFLHVRYKQSPTENRRLRTWITGGAGGARTNDEDAMSVHWLSERCLVTLGANNFFKFND